MSGVFNVMMVGVGGQGIVLASDILAEAAALSGQDVKKSEIHGMSRRGGPVFSHVRFGERVYSPVIDNGKADVIVATEQMELIRWAPWARLGADACYLDAPIMPVGVTEYPPELGSEIKRLFSRVVRIEPSIIGRSVQPKMHNTVLLGAASLLFPLPEDSFRQALEIASPKGSFDTNLAAFEIGLSMAKNQLTGVADVE